MLVMLLAVKILVAMIALEHLYFLWLEMFSWTSKGPKVFPKQPKDSFASSKTLAANQGLYNGFLTAGLVWSLLITNTVWARYVSLFFLTCVVVAGMYGGVTVERKIVVLQALPALITLVLLLLS